MKNYLRISAISIIASGVAMALASGSQAYEYTDVKLSSPGDLSRKYDSLSTLRPEALRISGTLNSADVIALRALCGRDAKLFETEGTVRALDLSDISFTPDPNAFIWYNNMQDSVCIPASNSLPPIFLYQCNVEEITLPRNLDTIPEWSLAGMPLKELYINDGVTLKPRSIITDSLLTKIRLPLSTALYQFSDEKVNGLKEVESGGFIYASRSAFMNLPEIERFTVNGPCGHIDATPFINNPRLKEITFNGPVFSTGSGLAFNCDSLQSVTFNAPVGDFGFSKPENANLPMLGSYTFKSPVLFAPEWVECLDSTEIKSWHGREEFLQTYADLIRKSAKAARNGDGNEIYLYIALSNLESFSDSIESRRFLPEYDSLAAEVRKYDAIKSKIQILQESAPYAEAHSDTLRWSYAPANDSLLTVYREKYNLDSIAGPGDDYSKIKNLTYWIHEMMPHNGSRPDMPKVPFRLDNLIEYAQQDSTGGNCRILATALNQALLAEGIPARFLTCQSKNYDTDPDCHVICTAWCDDLQKWVWCDPSFAAFVTAPDGTPLHPGEVRQRLIGGEEICLNEDANWNHKVIQTKEEYLDDYMAKNLYLISAYNQSRPLTEGPEALTEDLQYITLEPQGFGMKWTHRTTSDYESFWAAPEVNSGDREPIPQK